MQEILKIKSNTPLCFIPATKMNKLAKNINSEKSTSCKTSLDLCLESNRIIEAPAIAITGMDIPSIFPKKSLPPPNQKQSTTTSSSLNPVLASLAVKC